jgi:hypothetical protein
VLVWGTYRERSRQSHGLGCRRERLAVGLVELKRGGDTRLDVIRKQRSGDLRGNAVQAALHSRRECRRAGCAPVRRRVFLRLEDDLAFRWALRIQHIKRFRGHEYARTYDIESREVRQACEGVCNSSIVVATSLTLQDCRSYYIYGLSTLFTSSPSIWEQAQTHQRQKQTEEH